MATPVLRSQSGCITSSTSFGSGSRAPGTPQASSGFGGVSVSMVAARCIADFETSQDSVRGNERLPVVLHLRAKWNFVPR
jgi:hypothetical protein